MKKYKIQTKNPKRIFGHNTSRAVDNQSSGKREGKFTLDIKEVSYRSKFPHKIFIIIGIRDVKNKCILRDLRSINSLSSF